MRGLQIELVLRTSVELPYTLRRLLILIITTRVVGTLKTTWKWKVVE